MKWFFKPVQEKEDQRLAWVVRAQRLAWVERFLKAYDFALEVDVEVGDRVDVDIRKLFESEIQASDDSQVVACASNFWYCRPECSPPTMT